jgi:hypothetical protein
MSFRFEQRTRDKAKELDNCLVGVHLTSPHRNKGTDMIYQSPALPESESNAFGQIVIKILSGKIAASKVLELINSQLD